RHLHAVGLEETVEHLRSHGRPILTLAERPIAPSVVVRPLAEPVPLYPWTMVYRRELRHSGLDALHASADEFARSERWLELPPDAWIPEPDAATFEIDANRALGRPPLARHRLHFPRRAWIDMPTA